jgi:hypothetical protein
VENKYSPQPLNTHSPLPRRRQLDYCTPCRRNPSVRISEAAQPALVFCPSGKHPGDSLVCELGGLGYFDVGLSVGVRAEKNGCVIVSLLGASGEMVEGDVRWDVGEFWDWLGKCCDTLGFVWMLSSGGMFAEGH